MHHYSVLMSVYGKEKAEYLTQAVESMLTQTVRPSDFVLVCDGPLSPELNRVIAQCEKVVPALFQVVRLPDNKGLGNALNVGLNYCKYDLVARMDSDDISRPERCEEQLALFASDPNLTIVSAVVCEFEGTTDAVGGSRKLPLTHDEICAFSRKRSPFNHPVVMFRKESVIRAGGYRNDYPYFEDYDLWVRLLRDNCRSMNLDKTLLYMRAGKGMYRRRSGRYYAKYMLQFHRDLRKSGWITWGDYLTGAVPHAMLSVLPTSITKWVYQKLHQ